MHSIPLFYGFVKYLLQTFCIMEYAVVEATYFTVRARGPYTGLRHKFYGFKMLFQLREIRNNPVNRFLDLCHQLWRRLFQRAAFPRLRDTVTLP